ncbi:cytochrome c oxidase subunit II [Methylopila musalis]|uniref:Cytochrome aa3 subunit 2 n=1 Tax=Methylopila musalis TaxID=1134781 RepID=A0ABW3Z628_9HYPH
MARHRLPLAGLALVALGLSSCAGVQSALDPAGHEARQVATLFWVMTIGAGVVWCLVLGVAVYATRLRPEPHGDAVGWRLILWGGVVFPTVTLTALLVYGLGLMPQLREPGEGLRIDVSGEQFWWRITYRPAEGPLVVSANEIRLPVGERVEFALTSPDVIHAFWIPSLGGKVDMIPGRENRLVLKAETAGVYRGACTEFCGASHALMAFDVVAMEKAEFAAWLAAQSTPPPEPDGEAKRGRDLFLRHGCGACHRVSGTEASGEIGPDLTRFGARATLGAATLPNTPDAIARFVREVDVLKPRAKMPAYPKLPADELSAIAVYLGSLK